MRRLGDELEESDADSDATAFARTMKDPIHDQSK